MRLRARLLAAAVLIGAAAAAASSPGGTGAATPPAERVAGQLAAVEAPWSAAPPRVGGRAYIVVSATTGEVLASRRPDVRRAMASITKLMTVLVTLEHAKPSDTVTATDAAAAVGESSISLKPGERLTVRELIEAALIQSANDSADALAVHVGRGSLPRFVALMNAKARELRLTRTHFANPDGLDAPGHYSTARDVTRLARIAMRNPVIRDVVSHRTAHIAGGRTLRTWNDLLGTFPNLLGVKTGHTDNAGWSQVAAARGQGVVVYATLLGEPTREQRNADLAALLAWGIDQYRVVPLVRPGRVLASAALPYGKDAVGLVSLRGVTRVVRLGRTLRQEVVAPATLSLPVAKGERLGEVRILDGSRVLARVPLVAARSVTRPGALGRARYYAGRAFHHAWEWIT